MNNQPTIPSEVARIMALVRTCYAKLQTGSTDVMDFKLVQDAINVGLVRANDIAEELVERFQEATHAMLECERLRRRHGHYGFHAPELVVINEALELYEQILSLSSPKQLHAAATEVDRLKRIGQCVNP